MVMSIDYVVANHDKEKQRAIQNELKTAIQSYHINRNIKTHSNLCSMMTMIHEMPGKGV